MLAGLDEEPSTLDKAKRISLSFSRNGGKPYGQLADLDDKLNTISSPPQGYCNDHTEVFLALASVAGIDTSELIVGGHVTCDVYCPEWKRWVWIDPEFALLAKGPDGHYLSGIELHEAYAKDEPFEFEFFGLPVHEFSQGDPREHKLYGRDFFLSRFGVVWGNNVFTVDGYRSKMLFIPKAGRQAGLMILGVQPQYRLLADQPSRAPPVIWRVVLIGLAVLLLAAGTLAYPVYAAWSFVRRHRRTEESSPPEPGTSWRDGLKPLRPPP